MSPNDEIWVMAAMIVFVVMMALHIDTIEAQTKVQERIAGSMARIELVLEKR